MSKELYEIGEIPPLGVVPARMYAWLIRPERFGQPNDAFKVEIVDVPEPGDYDVLVYVMAAGINYNNVWAGLGLPVDVIGARNKAGETEKFHIGGSDASGIVYKVGRKVTHVKVGDEVVVHCATYDPECPAIAAGTDQMYSPSFRIWGYETNWGSFAQFTRVQAHQCLPKPKHLTWEAAAAYMLVGATAYRMMRGWKEHELSEGDVALIWGGAGGLGSMAIQIARAVGAVPVAVVSSDDKVEYCKSLGAKGCINRNGFDHWGMLPHWKDDVGYAKWLKGVRSFGKAIWDVLGEKKSPKLVFEHPGETTIPTSLFVCDTGGMVSICAGTTGFNATVDLRYMWMRQKRVQGSHFANDQQCEAFNDMVRKGLIDPCLSKAFTWDEIPHAHQLMYENKHPHGNMAVLVGAQGFGSGASAEDPHLADHLPVPENVVHPDPGVYPVAAALPGMGGDEPAEVPFYDDGTKVGAVMNKGLISCRPDQTVGWAAELLLEAEVGALVVIEDGLPIGMFSHTDLVLARQGHDPAQVLAMPVRNLMSGHVLTCSAATPLADAVSTMARHRIHRLVVTENQGGRDVAVGVVTMGDVVRSMVDRAG